MTIYQPRAMASWACLLACLWVWPFSGGKRETLTVSRTIPGASAYANVGHDKNGNTTVDLHVKFLPNPSSLTPAETNYVVWVQPRGHAPQNKGKLRVNSSHSGSIVLRSAFRDFNVFITAEASVQVTRPSGQQLVYGRITR